jgi:hypothetical protein
MTRKKESEGRRRPAQRRMRCIKCKHFDTEDLQIIPKCKHHICADCLDELEEETVEDDDVVRSSVKRILFCHTQLLRLFRLSIVLDAKGLSTPTTSRNGRLLA